MASFQLKIEPATRHAKLSSSPSHRSQALFNRLRDKLTEISALAFDVLDELNCLALGIAKPRLQAIQLRTVRAPLRNELSKHNSNCWLL
ncbi:hypothetical protein HG15A2_34520 [Adhaeretor mobilis]|uniref:Uncharacterized protein n=1 Tax=Adhaeretor mobilis TaxID=1930276 RepID=A0A517MZ18_9BACT|nr:hypothetical protein HG15A2_34520 [Adhaeretor mobilis]